MSDPDYDLEQLRHDSEVARGAWGRFKRGFESGRGQGFVDGFWHAMDMAREESRKHRRRITTSFLCETLELRWAELHDELTRTKLAAELREIRRRESDEEWPPEGWEKAENAKRSAEIQSERRWLDTLARDRQKRRKELIRDLNAGTS
jgi:hypothetical protein